MNISEIIIPTAFRILRPPDGRQIRRESEVREAIEIINAAIWSQAGIVLDLIEIETVDAGIPMQMLAYIHDKVDSPDLVPGANLIGYSTYWHLGKRKRDISGNTDKNGFANASTKAFAVKTFPILDPIEIDSDFEQKNHFARVVAHEVGHCLGLVGDLADYRSPDSRSDELMYSGSEGTRLTDLQIRISRDTSIALIENL